MRPNFLKRVASGRESQPRWSSLHNNETYDFSPASAVTQDHSPGPHQKKKRQPVNNQTNARPAKGGFFFPRFNRKKKTVQETPKTKPQRTPNFTPVTLASNLETEVELSLFPRAPPSERESTSSVTTQTLEVSDTSGSADIFDRYGQDESLPPSKKPLKRACNARTTSSSRLMVDTSAVSLPTSRSVRMNRPTGNESLGDVKPLPPRRGVLPPLLDADEDHSLAESSCSGITMDFTYTEEGTIKSPPTPTLAPAFGMLGLTSPPPPPLRAQGRSPKTFVPPTYIMMAEESNTLAYELRERRQKHK